MFFFNDKFPLLTFDSRHQYKDIISINLKDEDNLVQKDKWHDVNTTTWLAHSRIRIDRFPKIYTWQALQLPGKAVQTNGSICRLFYAVDIIPAVGSESPTGKRLTHTLVWTNHGQVNKHSHP